MDLLGNKMEMSPGKPSIPSVLCPRSLLTMPSAPLVPVRVSAAPTLSFQNTLVLKTLSCPFHHSAPQP